MTQEIITITVEAGQMTARRKSRKIAQRRPVPVWAIVKYRYGAELHWKLCAVGR